MNVRKSKFLYEKKKIVEQDEINIQQSSINQAMPAVLFTGATFVKINSCLVAWIDSFDTAGLHLLTLRILEPYPSKDIELDLSHVILHQWR